MQPNLLSSDLYLMNQSELCFFLSFATLTAILLSGAPLEFSSQISMANSSGVFPLSQEIKVNTNIVKNRFFAFIAVLVL